MPIYTNPKTKRLYIKFQRNGLNYQKTLPVDTTLSEAKDFESEWKSQLFREEMGLTKTPDKHKDILFQNFVVEYYLPHVKQNAQSSLSRAKGVLKDSGSLFKNKTLREIKPFDIERFKVQQANKLTWKGTQRKPATVLRELSILSALFSLAVNNDFCDINPVSRVDKPKFNNISDKILKEEDEEKYFAAFKTDWARDVCKFALHTGLRQKDILALTHEKIFYNESLIILTMAKTTRRVVIPLNDTALEILNRWDKGKGLIFPSPKNKQQATSVKRSCVLASERAGIERITIKDLRRTFATRLIEKGVDSFTVAELLGHSDTRIIRTYARGKVNLFDAVKKLEKK